MGDCYPPTPSELRDHCVKYLRSQILPQKSLWGISPAVERSIGFIDACKVLHGMTSDTVIWLREEIQQCALGVREGLINDFYPPRSSRRHEVPIIEPAVNWWGQMHEHLKRQWLEYLATDSPLDAWDEHQRVSQEYDVRCKSGTLAEANKWLFDNIPKALW